MASGLQAGSQDTGSSVSTCLDDLGQVPSCLWASVSSSMGGGIGQEDAGGSSVLRGQRLVIKLGVGKMRSWGRGKGLESSWVGAVKGTSVQPQPQGSQTRQQNWDPPNQNQRGKAKSMSKERLGRKHVIRTNSQPALGSHWPCWREEAAIGAPLSHNPRPTRLARDSRVET